MTDLRKAAEMLMKALDDGWVERGDNVAIALRQALAQPEQEPVAWLVSDAQGRYATIRDPAPYGEEVYEPLYAAPSKREWVGLTDEEKLISIWKDGSFHHGVEWAEAKLKEKNA